MISTPVSSATTHTFTLQQEHRRSPKKLPTKLFSFIRGRVFTKERERKGARKKERREEKRESCKKKDGSHTKRRMKTSLLLGESSKGARIGGRGE